MDLTKQVNDCDFKFKETCHACPEQYDVFLKGKRVGHVRLRCGDLWCEYPDVAGEIIYFHSFVDDFLGRFKVDNDRESYLEKIAESLYNRILQTENLNGCNKTN